MFIKINITFATLKNADVAKLADAPDLGSGAARRVGSTPIIRTTTIKSPFLGLFFLEKNYRT